MSPELKVNGRCSDLFDIIKTRRAIRAYVEGKKIPDEHLKLILEAGIWAPSGSNIQPWEFILVNDDKNVMKVKMLTPGMFSTPSTIIILCVNKQRSAKGGKMGDSMAIMDLSMAAQNMMLMAHCLGIGSCPILSFSKEGLKELLDIPEHIEPVMLLALGYPKVRPKPPRRRPLQEVVHAEQFGKRPVW